jgi:ribosomal protein L44E
MAAVAQPQLVWGRTTLAAARLAAPAAPAPAPAPAPRARKSPRKRAKLVSHKQRAAAREISRLAWGRRRFARKAARILGRGRPNLGEPRHRQVVAQFCLSVLGCTGSLLSVRLDASGGEPEWAPAVVIDVDTTGDAFRVMMFADKGGRRRWDIGEPALTSGSEGYWIDTAAGPDQRYGYRTDTVSVGLSPRWTVEELL